MSDLAVIVHSDSTRKTVERRRSYCFSADVAEPAAIKSSKYVTASYQEIRLETQSPLIEAQEIISLGYVNELTE